MKLAVRPSHLAVRPQESNDYKSNMNSTIEEAGGQTATSGGQTARNNEFIEKVKGQWSDPESDRGLWRSDRLAHEILEIFSNLLEFTWMSFNN